jgi:DNA-directed RNA polymerase specialized sigma24 family protein
MNDTNEFEQQIETAIKKYARDISKQDKEDIRQDARVSILSYKDKMTKKLAADISRKRVIDFLRRSPPRSEDISDPDVQKKADRESVHFPDIDLKLDCEKAVELAERLSEPYKSVIIFSFGIYDEPVSDKDLAIRYKKSVDWVYRTRQTGLLKLRTIMENK